MKPFVKKFIYEKFSSIFKKKSSVHVFPRVEINGKIKIANARQRKADTVHLLRTSSTVRFVVFLVLIIEAISVLNLEL